jgi:hypothetical protein
MRRRQLQELKRQILDADRAEIKGSIFLRDSFSAEGPVNLLGAQVGGSLDCGHGRFRALQLETVTVKRIFVWRDVQSITELDLEDAAVGAIWDDETSWPRNGNLYLDGFVYGGISLGPKDALTRLRWLDRQREFTPQPYRQLARVLRDLEDDEGAKQVLFELESRARAEERKRIIHAPVRWLRFTKDTFSEATVGYGIYPGRAIWYLGG